nr:hypothetical protein [Tessaracoccus coleopterorum]
MQLSVPIAPTPASQVYAFALSLARYLSAANPKLFIATMSREARSGLIFVDFAQNLAARNTVTAYSVRGLEAPSVATPLTWEEVAALRPDTVLRTSPPRPSPGSPGTVTCGRRNSPPLRAHRCPTR